MDSIKDILAKKDFEKPTVVDAVINYISTNFKSKATVQISGKNLVIIVKGSSLANQIRLRQVDIYKKCDLGVLKLVIRTN